MYQTVNFSSFCDAFRAQGREDQFTYDAMRVLFDHLEDVDPDHEVDVIALCCAYAEDEEDAVRRNYSIEGDVIEWLLDHTMVAGVTPAGAVVYCSEF